MKKALKVVLINLIVFIALWAILELISSKIYQDIPERYRNGKRIVEANLNKNYPKTEQSILSHPYLLYVNNPDYFDSVKQHNSLGYRSPEFSIEKDSNTIRVLALGGSTTYGYLNRNPKSTWPARLQEELQQITKKKVEVINGGLNYATSAELLSAYIFRHRYIKADIIIIHEGRNDGAPVMYPDYNPEYSHFRSVGNGIKLRPREKLLLKSNVFKLFYAIWLNSTETIYAPQPYPFSELDKGMVSKRVRNDSNYIGFYRNMDLLVSLAQSDKSKVYLMGFVNAKKEKIISSRPDLKHIADEVIYSTNKNNEIMKDISLHRKIGYIDLEQDLFKPEWFMDDCHLNDQGEKMKAHIVFNRVKELFY